MTPSQQLGALYKIYITILHSSYHRTRKISSVARTDSVLTVNGNNASRAVSQMTDDKDETCSPTGMSVAALVCGGRLFHACAEVTGNAHSPRADRDSLMTPASSGSRQSSDSDKQLRLMSAAGCLPEMPVLCRVIVYQNIQTELASLRDA